ncbi:MULTISPECIES: DoxX family membrane protein [Flagellimonas]|uniref:DoxX family membrane protein n=1 Tax=Flagellimonas hadalis TaxID=2597517 RepID=A0A5N5ITH5_9FLAO|nr:DoxX family membrane protein [Allomuricauda hadalis]KAB5487541.1 DoxX family membrane protein [Allomuricauda hadalis]RUA16382.1 MAG: DoxX family protein [Flavobacteriia bacterium]
MKNKILFVLALLFGLMFANAGLNKFLNYMPMPEEMPEALLKDFQALMEISWLMPLVGLAELIGGILIIIPRTRALGALILFPVMVGILLVNTVVDTSGLVIALVLAVIMGWIMYENRHKYRPIFQ